MTNPEICYMIDFRKMPEIPASCQRIYFGHETCEKLLPAIDEIRDLLEISQKRRLGLTFVTPFLTEKGMDKVLLFLEQLKNITPQTFEIATSDWGLIHHITMNNTGTPVVGRFLTGQQLDFRLANAERNFAPEMVRHLSSCSLLKEKTVEMLHRLGVNRFELSNVFQPIALTCDQKYRCSLHVPFVPLTIFRTCPENLDFNCAKKTCNIRNCNHNRQKWVYRSSKCDIYCLDNALYYRNPDVEHPLKSNEKIDRIVYHELMYDV